MNTRRFIASTAVTASLAIVLAACGGSGDDNNDVDEPSAGGGKITVAETNSFTSFNSNTPDSSVDINSKIQLATSSDFNYVGEGFAVVKDESFGTYEVTSQDPFTVKYTVNEGVQWSDGNPVDADDLLLAWAVLSGYYDSATYDDEGAVSKGAAYFSYAGSTLPDLLTKVPTVGDDGRSITIEYAKPYSDWEIAYGVRLTPPAHVVWKAAGIASAEDFIKLLQDTPKGDAKNPAPEDPALKKAADFYNTGFDTTKLPSDKSLYLSDGPFIVSDIEENASVTLVKNDKYVGDHEPSVDTIVMRTIGDATAQVKAMENGEADIIAPQASADTLSALEDIPDVTVHKGAQSSYDHLDLKFKSKSGVFKDKNVREAFLKTVPRQAILDAIITPLDPEATVLDSQMFLTSQSPYADTITANGSDAYPGEPDIEGAKALLAGAKPTVKILYNRDNPNRVDAYTLIAASASKAGFVIEDMGAPGDKWSASLPDLEQDVNIFGWINSGVGVSGVPQIFATKQGGNYTGYSNPEVDALTDELLITPDTAKQVEIQQQIDGKLWADAYGLPLFQSVGVDAVSSRVKGVDFYYPGQSGVWWNVWEWSLNG